MKLSKIDGTNRKGAMASMAEIGFSLVLFVFIIILFFVFAAVFGEGKVVATMEAENAAFTCGNNIVKFMNFNAPGKTDYTYEDMLLAAYVQDDYFDFEVDASKLFNKFIYNRWRMRINNATHEIHRFGSISLDLDSTETCIYRLAVPCLSYQDCTVYAQLELDYKSKNVAYAEIME